jgi:GSH-dependent disulfide-bond oxidoreductase
MNHRLFHGEPNGPSLTVLAALFESNVEADLERIDLAAGERHSSVPHSTEVDYSIEGEGPVLVADGTSMTDSVFIACYMDEVGGGTRLRPSDPYERWQMMAWCRWVIERIAPAAAYLGLKSSPPSAVPHGIVSVDLADRWRQAVRGEFDESKLADSREKIGQAADKLEKQLEDGRDWLMSDFSIADLETYAWLAGMRSLLPEAFDGKARTIAWFDRIKVRRSVAWALSLATVDEPERVWAPGPEINRWG